MKKTPETYLESMDVIPPNICRILARTPGKEPRPLTQPEIAEKAGWPWQKVAWISRQRSWKNVTVGDADTFRAACGITRTTEKAQIRFLARVMAGDEDLWDRINQKIKKKWHQTRFIQALMKNLE